MQKGNIGVTTENIFPVIKKFLYSDHEIFLREMVSNAVDATQKMKTLAEKGEFKGELGDLTVRVSLDEKNKTLTISDNGIGMTEEEIDKYIDKHSKDEKQEVQNFLQKIASRPGSIYESNLITQIILNLVEDAKTNMGTNKKIILVIDDLDRIDPEHIFRILNILSVHNDFGNQQEHKFGFDKTILVCDIDNIRNIYRAKYGINDIAIIA